MPRANKRDDIIQRAYRIFYRHGFHATGVEALLADTGISKRTLYRHFGSKEELIVAAVAYYQTSLLEALPGELARRAGNPEGQLLAIFDLKREAFERGDFTGCFAINAKLEFEGKHPAIESACVRFNKDLEQLMGKLCEQAGLRGPEQVARQLMLLLEGTIVYAQIHRDPTAAVTARETAASILRAALPRGLPG
ncbi:MAG: TetR/AcrR family transcriptional regulator [Pseudomonadota bacterium]|nr:TetR/AcrR family transcriptional regulator [Pseudomonadota bacterium]